MPSGQYTRIETLSMSIDWFGADRRRFPLALVCPDARNVMCDCSAVTAAIGRVPVNVCAVAHPETLHPSATHPARP